MDQGTAVAQWLRRCATNRKVAGSIQAGVSGFFIDIKSFRSHYGPRGKGGRCVRLTTSLNLCTGRPPTERDDTRCCIIQF